MRKNILLLSLILITTLTTSAESATNSKKEKEVDQFQHGVGVAAGFVTAVGLSYRYLGEPLAIQFTFTPYISSEEALISSGITFIKRAYTGRSSNLFVYLGFHYLYEKYYDEYEKDDVIIKGDKVRKHHLNIGIGPGFEFHITDHIVFDLMAGYAIYMGNHSPTLLNFTGETGLFYYF